MTEQMKINDCNETSHKITPKDYSLGSFGCSVPDLKGKCNTDKCIQIIEMIQFKNPRLAHEMTSCRCTLREWVTKIN